MNARKPTSPRVRGFTMIEILTVVAVIGPDGRELARGVSLYDGAEVERIRGRHSGEIEAILGHTRGTTVIHRNDLVSLQRNGLKSEKAT